MKRTVARLITAVLVSTGAVVVLSAPAPTADASVDPVAGGVHVIGDSITWYAHQDVLATRPTGWTWDGVPGRRVEATAARLILPSTQRSVAIRHMFLPQRRTRVSTVVIALGTNGTVQQAQPEDVAAMYSTAITRLRKLPIWKAGPRRIVLVTPFTSVHPGQVAANGTPYAPKSWAERSATAARAITLVARRTPNVCVMPWRSVISKRPELLWDGVHPDHTGLVIWKRLLFSTIRSCATMTP